MGEGVAGGVRRPLTDAVSTGFGVVSGVGNGRRERFGVVGVAGGVGGFLDRSGGVTGLDIENFGVVVGEVVDGVVCEVVGEVVEVLSPSLLKLRPEALTISFNGLTWCWRICSCSLFFDSKVPSHCLQTALEQMAS